MSAMLAQRNVDKASLMNSSDPNAHTASENSVSTANAVNYMGFWARVLASIIDSILMLIVLVPIVFLLFGDTVMENEGQLDAVPNLIFNYLLPFCAILGFWILKSATPGKIALRGVIVDADTLEKPAVWQWLVRYLGYFVSAIPLGLGLLWVGWDARKQGFHDKLARTVVIYKNKPADS